ncbi:OHCU decarboxylase [Bacillus sp. MUM 116]|uniref:2-oxo-4-hydroxy-4-carboxy-5-ureidoimidazoline decarboxylase n=1 Tax=Bacillus sp. MUM 116 TaxID=1678002 RepID=UPI0008F5E02B|nr:2-oxo-4-hydroxy-4-carboxy-5-ureidoimidazoline decarboxylase [Bacillus sp. MUM 116]OIK08316.1 OHCU decarboxylase [Bacillus sp. MUM 116]
MSRKLAKMNELDQTAFTEALGWVFEHSPWVAEKAWVNRPFHSISELHRTMVHVVQEADLNEKLALLRAHPDLAGRVQMADASVKEQAGAGLHQLSREEHEEFLLLNKTYIDKFEFPFIMAVKGQNKESIKQMLRNRLHNGPEAELNEALEQIYKITRFRLEDFLNA